MTLRAILAREKSELPISLASGSSIALTPHRSLRTCAVNVMIVLCFTLYIQVWMVLMHAVVPVPVPGNIVVRYTSITVYTIPVPWYSRSTWYEYIVPTPNSYGRSNNSMQAYHHRNPRISSSIHL